MDNIFGRRNSIVAIHDINTVERGRRNSMVESLDTSKGSFVGRPRRNSTVELIPSR